jgi:RNA polymerase sigma-70 factor (ECF subfamily)
VRPTATQPSPQSSRRSRSLVTLAGLADTSGRVRRRDSEPEVVFERLYREFGPEVLAFCRRRVAPDLADDATAETFLVVWRRLSEVPRSPRGWLLRVARLTLSNQLRGKRRREALIERVGWDRSAERDVVDARPVIEALTSLSQGDQEALLLSAWDGLNSREAGQVLGCTPAAFRLRLYRARRRLERALIDEPRIISFAVHERNPHEAESSH